MESLSSILQPFKDQIVTIAILFTVLQFLLGILVCKKIYANGNTVDESPTPFVTSFVMSLIMMKYANMTDDWLMFQINTVALVLNALYITFYMLYTEDQFNEVLKQLAIGVAVIAIMFNYSKYEDQEVVKWRYGVITTIFMLILLALPLFELQAILKDEDASKIDATAAIVGAIVSFLWLLYGISVENTFLIVQNILCLIICGAQIILKKLYPGNRS